MTEQELKEKRQEEMWIVRKGVTRGLWFFFWEFSIFFFIIILPILVAFLDTIGIRLDNLNLGN